ncbi:uncharacterized protein LAESUDRAFT_808936 [Laetiporus sulphureus 93-53]|uniref:Uncharacterized protein n=1 Tax=Laetiporus sulphureus 93-53 TaxID=1314785 RepID=A0A165HPZ2_9APHY|nr:uncharacterized protein LAESUDRAFT_808936 [Laetiporus sulphureus 93-53]KZT12029.1 hypothetical protein LAESUDRAFT_808936 [Laetiporus sulphureus 93-53]
MQAPTPQPDYPLLQQSLTTAAEQLALFANIPQHNDIMVVMQQIHATIQQMNGTIEQMNGRITNLENTLNQFKVQVEGRFNQVEERFNQIGGRFDQLAGKVDNIVRMLPTMLHNAPLRMNGPLQYPSEVDDRFPKTELQLTELTANDANHVLLALGMEVPQGADVVRKRQLIADYLGCGETVV